MIENIKRFPHMLLYDPQIEGKLPRYEGGRVVVMGMGGSAIVGDIFRDWIDLDVRTLRHYTLPSFYNSHDTFVAISYSGNTEETLSAYRQAVERGLKGFVVTSGGELREMAKEDGVGVVLVPKGYHPREAFGYLFKALVFGAKEMGMISKDSYDLFIRAAENLKKYTDELEKPDSSTYEVASQIYRRIPLIYSDASIFSVALRWKAQINENANAFAHAVDFPEHNHNDIEGFDYPEFLSTKAWIVLLKTEYDHPRIRLRMDLAKEILKDYVLGYSEVLAKGESKLEQMLYLVWFGDFVSYWLTVEYGGDPYRIDRIKRLKELLVRR